MDPDVNCFTSVKIGMCLQILVNPFDISLYENPFSSSGVVTYGERRMADRHVKLIGTFVQFFANNVSRKFS
jgi:hypothetical protein